MNENTKTFPREMTVFDEFGDDHRRIVISNHNGRYQTIMLTHEKRFEEGEPFTSIQHDNAEEIQN